VILMAAADMLRSAIGAAVTTQDLTRNEQSLEFARAQLGLDAFAAAWEEGKALSLEEVVALALEAPTTLIPSEATVTPTALSATERVESNSESELTPREIEVLRLVAVGLTNPDIAEHLSLSVNTVQTHLRSIFSKLNISTRSAAVRYVFEHSLS
jgi:DNA-binding NarL/FixJ family response regulator